MKKLILILSLFIFTSCAALNSAKGELHLEINITKGQELLDLKKALDAGAITATEFELMKQRVIDDYYMKKAIDEKVKFKSLKTTWNASGSYKG